MKRKVLCVLLLVALTLPLSARAYVGVSQGLVASSVEVGYMTRSFEQNLSLSLPLLHADCSLPMASVNLFYRIQRLNPLVIGLGPAARITWRGDTSSIMAGGFALSLSWETVMGNEILFAEFSYLPYSVALGGSLEPLATDQIGQWARIGWRHLF